MSKAEKETISSKDVATVTAVMKPAFQFTIAKIVTVPLLKQAIDVPVYVRIEGAVFVGKELKQTGATKMEAAHLVNVTNLETGEAMQLIVPAVLQSILHDEYANDAYVGKSFQLIKHAKPSGKAYSPYTVNEITVTQPEVAAQ